MGKVRTIFERETKLSPQQQRKLINWFKKQPLEAQVDIFKEQKNQFFILKNSDFNSENLLSIISFYIAMTKFYNLNNQIIGKNKTMRLQIKIQRHYKVQKAKVKREKLLNIWSKIQELKSNKYSFREIKIYIKQKHRFDVSHTYIQQIWQELENA